MSLEEQLAALRQAGRSRAPAEFHETFERFVTDLRASGIDERVLQPGQKAPAFSLPNHRGETVVLADRLARGPVVLSFFRGRW